MPNSNMRKLADFGQSIWLDYIDRPLLETGKLKKLIDNGLRGMTSNPSIFNSAIGASTDYDEEIIKLKGQGKTTFEIYDKLTIKDIQTACDQFLNVYQETDKLDGYVSLEINPQLANKIADQIKEGKRLHKLVNRPNLMVKVPSTKEGLSVIEELIASGINVNATLIFSCIQYQGVAQAYLNGLTRYAEIHDDLSHIHSVASFFVSRIDSTIDTMLCERIKCEDDPEIKINIKSFLGKAAVTNCRVVFEKCKEIYLREQFRELRNKKANKQRLLWASTGTKNPEYSDIKYVTELIAKPTVNTLPEKTLNAFMDHGIVKEALNDDINEIFEILGHLQENKIDINEVCQKLQDDGVKAFDKAFTELFNSIEQKAAQLSSK